MKNLKGTEKQIKYANDLLIKLKKYTDKVIEGYEKGNALDEEKQEFNEFYNAKIKKIVDNEKSWEVIYQLEGNVKKLYFLEDEDYLNRLKEQVNNNEIEFEYNLADTIVCKLNDLF